MFFQEIINFFFEWLKSRKWSQLLPLALVTLAIPALSVGFVAAGLLKPRATLASEYQQLIDQEMPVDEDGSPSRNAQKPNRLLQVSLRRILRMGVAGDRVKYFVGLELSRQSRFSLAERTMREIAPPDKVGYPDAHSWLAAYNLNKRVRGFSTDNDLLLHDLAVANDKASLLTPELLRAYAVLLTHDKRGEEALLVLRRNRARFPELNVDYAELAKRLGEQDDFRDAIREGNNTIEQRIKEGTADGNDLVRLVRLTLLNQEYDKALQITRDAVVRTPESPVLKAMYSQALFAKYKSLGEEVELAQKMQLLNAAFKADPTNGNVVAEVAKSIALGQKMPTELKEALEKNLADGTAPAIAHMILANNKLVGDNPESAIVHLELALRQLPESAIVMNNLAVAILQTRPDEIGRADELVEAALKIRGSTPQMIASMLDTQGQIRLARSDWLGAIDSFENAIRLDKEKINTRERLAETYERVGMSDLAAVQTRRIKQLMEEGED